MAVDTRSLVYLIDPFWQGENINGKPLVGGYMEVYVAGTDTKYITWSDWDGARHPFRIPLKSDGRACILVEPQFTYDCYLYDSFGNLACSRLNVSPEIGGDVSVSGLTQVYHDETISGNGTPYEPLGIVSGGKTYEGIEPIVVNNDVNKISANNVALGLQEPLFFVEDSETACVIGCSAQTEIPSALSGKWDDASDVVIANSAQWSENTEYEAGSYVDITDNTISITGLQPEGDYAYNSALSSKLDVTALPQDLVHSGDLTAYQSAGNYLSATDSANFLLTSDSGNFYPMEGNPSRFLTAHQSLDDYATKQWVEDKGYITGIDIQESGSWNEATTVVNNNSAIWNNTTNVVSSNSAQWGASNPQIPVTGINGIKISESGDKVVFEVSGDYATIEDVESATSGLFPKTAVTPMVNNIMGSVTGSTITYSNKPSAEAIYATNNLLYNVNYIVGSGININSSYLWLGDIVTATTGGITASGLSAGYNGSFAIQSVGELFLSEYEHGFIFSSVNTGLGTAKLTTANRNSIVTIFSPKFEAKNISGAGFSIEGSGAKGYDQNGNVTWDTTKPAKLIGWSNYQGTAIDPRASGINGNIIATVYPDQIPTSMAISAAPYSYMNGYGIYACNPDGTKLSVDVNSRSISLIYPGMSATAAMNPGDIQYNKYNTATSATDIWSLTGSVQKREIECDTATSAITAIAGSALSITYTTGTI